MLTGIKMKMFPFRSFQPEEVNGKLSPTYEQFPWCPFRILGSEKLHV